MINSSFFKMISGFQQIIQDATDLDDLIAGLKFAEDANRAEREMDDVDNDGIEQRYGVDLSDLPVFDGAVPKNSQDIFSWDKSRFLIADGSDWELINREDFVPKKPHYKTLLKHANELGYDICRGDYYGCGGPAQHSNNGDQWYVDVLGQPRYREGPGHATIAAAYDRMLEDVAERDRLKIQYPGEDWAD